MRNIRFPDTFNFIYLNIFTKDCDLVNYRIRARLHITNIIIPNNYSAAFLCLKIFLV